MSHSNLVLGRNNGQSIFIGTGEHAVKLTVVNATNSTLSFVGPVAADITHIDERSTKMLVEGSEVVVTVVSTNGKTVKLAFEADRHISIDREEIRSAKAK